jgi:hypothetical protein
MTERFHLRNGLTIQSVPCVNLGSASEVILPGPQAGSALSNILSSSDNSGHGAETVGQGASRGLVVSLALLRAITATQADTFGAVVVQDFEGVAVEDPDDEAMTFRDSGGWRGCQDSEEHTEAGKATQEHASGPFQV